MEQQSENNLSSGPDGSSKTLWIIGGIILAIMIVGLVYGATQKSLRNANSAADATAPLKLNTYSGSSTSVSGSGNAVLGASEMVPLPVTITGLEAVNLETFPQQVQAHVTYTLAGTCAVADTPTVAQAGRVFTVSVTSQGPKDAPCANTAVAGDSVVTIPVEGLAAGTYTIKAGKLAKTFVLKEDNEIQYSSGK